MGTVADDRFFHLRGRHVQHSHGRSTSESIESSGAMVALMPSEEDAQRLRLAGGERTEDLHLTLFFLGEGNDYSPERREQITNAVMDAAASFSPITARAFGVSHWNGDGEKPCWVLNIGDDKDSEAPGLEGLRSAISVEDIPAQFTPWAPHLCMAYTGDVSLTAELQKRLGPVTFDRVRVTFGPEYTDVQLGDALAAAGVLRRNLTETELRSRTDFVRMQSDWEDAVAAVLEDIAPIRDTQREELTAQVLSAAQRDDLDALESVAVSEESVLALETVLFGRMMRAAQSSGEDQQRAAEEQGVEVPEWSLGNLTAAAGAGLLRSIASVTSRVLSVSFVQSAVRRALSLVGRPQVSPEQVSSEVNTHLAELSEAGPRDAVGGAITAAQNEGRRIVMSVAPPAQFYESSEILDRNVCGPCRTQDGTRYETLPDATEAYPSGGYRDCLGGTRCRGTIVPVWEE